MPTMIHHLTHPGQLTASAVVCGATDATVATSESARITCPACLGVRAPCTCAPDAPPCAVCRQWTQTHRADGSRKAPPEPRRFHREQHFQEALRRLAEGAGWLYYHTTNSRKSPEGFVDTVLVRGPQLIFAELKMPGKTPNRGAKALARRAQVCDAGLDPPMVSKRSCTRPGGITINGVFALSWLSTVLSGQTCCGASSRVL